MGDVVTLVEKAEEAVNADEAAELAKRMMTGAWLAGQCLGDGWAGVPQSGCLAKGSEQGRPRLRP